jgi:hypothetical protein
MLMSRLAVAAVIALIAADRVSAQQMEAFEERTAPGWVMTPSVALGVGFDDNPLLSTTGNPKPDDTITAVSPALDVAFTGKHTSLNLGYNGSLVRYRVLEENDSYDQGAHAELRQQVSRRVGLSFRNAYTVSPTTDTLQFAGVPFFRLGTRQNAFSADTTIQATRGLELKGSYRFQWLEFDRPFEATAPPLDGGTAHGVSLVALHAISPRVSVGGGYTYLRALVGDDEEVFGTQDGEAAIAVQLSPTVALDAGAGFSRLALPDSLGTRIGPAARIALSKRTEHALFSLSAMRSFVPAWGFGGSFRNSEITGTIRVPFRGTRGFVRGGVSLRDTQPVLETELDITSLWLETAVGYALQRWLRLEAFYNGAFQDISPIAGGTDSRIDRNRVGVRIVTMRPVRIQ